MAAIDILALANHAEAINGLLYLSGAGWTNVTRVYPVGEQPNPHHFGIGISVLVPWSEANDRHSLAVWIESEDGGEPLMKAAEGELEVGRPAGLPHGSDLRSVLAIDATVAFPRQGGYRAVVELNGDRSTYAFTVTDRVSAPLSA